MANLVSYAPKVISVFIFTVLLAACGGGASSSVTPSGSTTTGSAALSWTIPTQNTDGTNLTNLNGYKIYYGTSPNALNSSIVLDNTYVNATTYEVTNLTVGTTYYFAITAVNSDGVESAYSNVGNKTI